MSVDRLAKLKAERDRARGYGQAGPASPPQQQQGQFAQQAGQQQQGYGGQQQYGGQQEPQMYPAQGGAQQGGQAGQYGAPQQGGQYAGAQQQGLANQQQQQQAYAPPQGQPPVQQGQYGAGQQGQYGAGQQGGYGQPQGGNAYEMQGLNGAGPGTLGAGNSMQDFFAEIESISQALQQLKGNIGQVNTLHTTILNSNLNDAKQEQAEGQLKQLTADTSRLTNDIKLRIKDLTEKNEKIPLSAQTEGDKNVRRMQLAVQKDKFMKYIQEYREVEAKSREKYRARMERQYKIVKPDATQEEIRYAMDTDQGSQVFANALTQSTRYADARNAYREVQERHEDIKRIAQTMQELQQLFNDMAMLVERQDEQIQTIEATAVDVETNMEAANKQIDSGVKSARKARRKRWICFWVLIIIIIAVVLAVTLSILSNQGKL